MTHGREITEAWHDEFQFDAALIPLMTESEQLRLGCHPEYVLFGGEVVPRRDITIGEKQVANWPQQNEEN
jgi:hypothetical protein